MDNDTLLSRHYRDNHIFDVSCREIQTVVVTGHAMSNDNRMAIKRTVLKYAIMEITVAYYYSDASAFGYGERSQNESNECFIDFSSFKKKSES